MNIKYKEYQRKLDKFNLWEKIYLKNLSVERKLWQFAQLYQLKEFLPKETVQRAQEEHLNNLIETQKIFREFYEKMKNMK
jgi:hypothetical protein